MTEENRSHSSEEEEEDEEEDGDEKWKAAINSVASQSALMCSKPAPSTTHGVTFDRNQDADSGKPTNVKYFQSRAQNALHKHLEETLDIVSDAKLPPSICNNTIDSEDICLFRKAPPGITLKNAEISLVSVTQKKPILLHHRKEIEERSVDFKLKINAVAVEGAEIISKGEKAKEDALNRLQAREAAALAALKKEKERVTILQRKRGTKWLPSLAKGVLKKEKCVEAVI